MDSVRQQSYPASIVIRPAKPEDFVAIHALFNHIVEEGKTLPYTNADMTEEQAHHWLMSAPRTYCHIAELNGQFAGSISLRPNRGGRAGHVAHATYMVDPAMRGQGIGRALGEHSLALAQSLNYQAMQFNFVVSVNEIAVNLWKSLGFAIIGTMPKAFQHASKGLVDVYMMHRFLGDRQPG